MTQKLHFGLLPLFVTLFHKLKLSLINEPVKAMYTLN